MSKYSEAPCYKPQGLLSPENCGGHERAVQGMPGQSAGMPRML